MIKLIIFDLWQTLAYRKVGYSTTSKMLKVTGSKIPKDKFVKIFEKSLQLKKWKSKKVAYKDLCKNMNLEPTEENINILMKIRDYAESKTRLYKYTLPLLKSLRKHEYKIGLISNGSIFAVKWIKRTPLLKLIDTPLFSYDIGVIKPNPLIFKKMLQMAKVKSHETIMVGDKLNDDIIPAKKLGLNTIHFTNYKKLKKDFSEFSIRI